MKPMLDIRSATAENHGCKMVAAFCFALRLVFLLMLQAWSYTVAKIWGTRFGLWLHILGLRLGLACHTALMTQQLM